MEAKAREPSLIVIRHLDTKSLRSLAATTRSAALEREQRALGHAVIDAPTARPTSSSAPPGARSRGGERRGGAMLALGLLVGLSVGRTTPPEASGVAAVTQPTTTAALVARDTNGDATPIGEPDPSNAAPTAIVTRAPQDAPLAGADPTKPPAPSTANPVAETARPHHRHHGARAIITQTKSDDAPATATSPVSDSSP